MRKPFPARLALGAAAAALPAVLALAGCRGMGGYPGPSSAPTAPAEAEAYPPPADEGDAEPIVEAVAGDLGGRVLVIGTDAQYPPFESVDDAGNVVGFDPDLMAAICERAHCTATFQSTSWDGIFAALSAGEFDALMSAITILPEREAESGGTFTRPYHQIGQVILRRSDDATPFDQTAAIVGVQTGTTGDTSATAILQVPEENMRRFESNALAVEALLAGDVDAVVCDDPTAANYVGAHPGELVLDGEPFTFEEYGILVPNTAPDVLEAFDLALEALEADGTLDALKATWLETEAETAP